MRRWQITGRRMVNWREELRTVQGQIASVEDIRDPKNILHMMIRYLPHDPLLVFYPDITVVSAYEKMSEVGVDFSLIQESTDTLLGVLSRDNLESLLQRSAGKSGELAVSAVMGRNICIEPDSASLLEVMDRMTMGSCPCTVIVDHLGHPRSIATPQTLVKLLSDYTHSHNGVGHNGVGHNGNGVRHNNGAAKEKVA